MARSWSRLVPAGLLLLSSMAMAQADTPYAAYEQGLFDQALQGFTDLQVEFPENPEVALNVGNAHYQMRNYAEADRAFSTAALATDPSLRAEALYNMGNSAFRQGRLEDAVGLYKAALEINPDDEDAKFNLEFVRNEIRRRHEEAQKRQEQQQQGQDQQQDPQQQDEQQQDEQQPNPQQGGQDSDQDGVPDAQEAPAAGQGAQAEGQEQAGLTPEEADRYLQALEEGRPVREQPQGARRSRTEKDW